MNTIALLVTGALGMLGWFFAWWGQRQVVSKDADVAAAHAGEMAAKAMALASEGKAATAAAQLGAEKERSAALQTQLDSEREARQHLVDELAKKGLPVGDVVVDAAVGRLYADGGGQGASADAGGDPQRLSGQSAAPSSPSGKG